MVLKAQTVQIRHVEQLVGLYSSALYAITHANLFHRYLDIDKNKALKKSNMNYNANMDISKKVNQRFFGGLQILILKMTSL